MASQTEPPDRRILDIATSHIRRYGLRRTTVVAIAEEAGMSHANVYRYFPSKGALVDAVAEQWLRGLEAILREIVDGPDPAYDKLERIIGTIQNSYRDKLKTDHNLFSIFADASEKGHGIARRHRNKLQSEIQRVIEEGISSGAFAEADHRHALALVFDALHRFVHPNAIRLDAEVPKGLVEIRCERMTRLVLATLTHGKY